MYKMAIRSWVKHLDFIILDMLCLALSLMSAIQIGESLGQHFRDSNPVGFILMILFVDLAVLIAFDNLNRVVTRGYFVEFTCTVRHMLALIAFTLLAMVIRNEDGSYPRVFFFAAGLLYFVSSYLTRILWKLFLRLRPQKDDAKRPILIVAESRYAGEVIERMREYSFIRYQIVGLVLIDRDARGEVVDGVPVVAGLKDAADFLCRNWVDDVFFFHASLDERTQALLDQCREMALTIHIYVAIQGVDERKQTINYIGGYEVLTANLNLMDPKDAFLKRSFDIVAGLAGSAITVVLLAILGPFIYIASPGPLIFRQERIGENGKTFRMYKIRSMYMDAEARKAALSGESTHGDGMMFKMDFDPRVIGNRILPDGRKKKGIGAFIRATSLDEFPQFFNVLKGDMSVVGTRPPTPDEWAKYQYRHRARMSIKPGMTGLWQIQPDKDYMSFEDVVRLDTEYISNWGIGWDIRIVLATAGKVLRGLLPGGKNNENGKRKEE